MVWEHPFEKKEIDIIEKEFQTVDIIYLEELSNLAFLIKLIPFMKKFYKKLCFKLNELDRSIQKWKFIKNIFLTCIIIINKNNSSN